jgi:hypothetical protein
VICGAVEHPQLWKGRYYCPTHKDEAERTKQVVIRPGVIITLVEKKEADKSDSRI